MTWCPVAEGKYLQLSCMNNIILVVCDIYVLKKTPTNILCLLLLQMEFCCEILQTVGRLINLLWCREAGNRGRCHFEICIQSIFPNTRKIFFPFLPFANNSVCGLFILVTATNEIAFLAEKIFSWQKVCVFICVSVAECNKTPWKHL